MRISLPRSGKKTPYLNQPKVLYVADKLGLTANLRLVEKWSRSRVKSANVKQSTTSAIGTAVSENLRNPGLEDYEMVLVSAPTDVITSFDT